MNRISLATLLLSLGFAAVNVFSLTAQTRVLVIDIDGEIDLGLGPYVERALRTADEEKVDVVALNVNTFGGRVDVATEVRDALLNTPLPTVAFIDRRAISAGALISLACDKIAMAPGGTIGAATPVYGSGERASEKVVSYMRSEMRATAEQNGRDPIIAEAMVDEAIAIPDASLKKPGQLLTLTTTEASRVGYSDVTAGTLESALAALGYADVVLVDTSMNWAESAVRFLTSPFVNALLIMLGLGGLFYAIKTGHFGTLAFIGITSLALFFGSQYLVDLANVLEIVLFAVGVILILAELFVIPGFGVAGVTGIVLMITGLFLALVSSFDFVAIDSLTVPLYTLAGAFVGLAGVVWLMVKYLPNSSAFRRFVLYGESVGDSELLPEEIDQPGLLGATGRALTTLRPAGTASIGDVSCDVISDGAFIRAGEPVRVIRVEGRKIVVQHLDNEEVEA